MTIPHEAAFPEEEFRARQDRVRQAMAARGIDTLVLHSAPNIYYLCGHHSLNLWDYQCLVLPQAGEPFMVLWQFERGRFAATAVACGVELYDTGVDFIAETAKALEKHGCLKGTIGIEAESRYLTPVLHRRLSDALEGRAKVANGSRICDLVRNVKTAREIAILREVGKATDVAMEAGFAAIREGGTDHEVAAAAAHSLIMSGSLAFALHPIVSAGYRAGMPHNTNCGKRIVRGETVFLEYSPTFHWYNAPLMRTAVLGEPSEKVKSFAALARETVETMLERTKPGARACDIALAAKAKIAPVRREILFHEVYGYPVGIGMPPTWGEESGFGLVESNERELEANMVFHIPMTLRLNGTLGVGLSHTVVVTGTGCEVLSDLPLDLRRVG